MVARCYQQRGFNTYGLMRNQAINPRKTSTCNVQQRLRFRGFEWPEKVMEGRNTAALNSTHTTLRPRLPRDGLMTLCKQNFSFADEQPKLRDVFARSVHASA